jgi:lipoprotein-releasing system permease protein
MYKLLLCWRYLRTRYLAMVCIVSVMLGVATLIVVNSVMGGFSTKLKQRLHGLLSDVVIEAQNGGTFDDPEGKMARIRSDPFLAERVEAMTPVHETFAMLIGEGPVPNTRPVHIIGIDPKGRALVGGFQEFLQKERNREDPARAFEADDEAQRRYWNEQMLRDQDRRQVEAIEAMEGARAPDLDLPPAPPPPRPSGDAKPPPDAPEWHLRPHVPQGAVVGYAIAHYRRPRGPGRPEPEEVTTIERGNSIVLTTVKGKKLTPVYDRFIVTDYVKTEMSEYDSNYIFLPLDHLQRLRGMEGRVTSILVKLKDYREAKEVVKRLQKIFDPQGLDVKTWEEKQGPLLAAISIEKGILNVLLFMIVAVAGFEILAIFSMIVVEKTRDIGILKALGASNGGVLKIFLVYGLLLGVVGAALGTALGLAFTHNINEIEKLLASVTGQEIFDRSIYYFDRIPTDIQPMSVLLVNLGAVAVAVLFSVLPALRAATLHPVRALRFE